MVKGKRFNYLLMSCVAAVWGVIFFRIYMGLNEEEPTAPVVQTVKTPYFKMIDHQADRISLDFGYRDPFDEPEAYTVSEHPISTNITLPKTSPITKPLVNWSGIQYTGYINNADSKKKRIILVINGNSAMFTEGQSANGLKLLKYQGDSVKVQYQEEIKYIKIK